MNYLISVPYIDDTYEFVVTPECETLEILVSRGNCCMEPIPVEQEDLPEAVHELFLAEVKKHDLWKKKSK